jgi:peptidyl-tRNA hydrolase
MKAYILIKEDVPLGFALVAAAHASMAMFFKFKDTPEVQEWVEGPFYKVICRVNEKEFEKAKEVEDHIVLTESALENQEVAVAFKPRAEWPKMMQFLRLYK